MEAIRSKHSPPPPPPKPIPEKGAVKGAAAANPDKVVRCGCGAVKRAGEFCPACGQG
jgi:hypothetical protein